MKPFFIFFFFISSMPILKSQPTAALEAFDAVTFISSTGDTLPYRVLWPKGYSDDKDSERFPVVLFLHGAGERGHDNQLQLTHGASLFLDKQDEFPAIVIMPQCRADDYWAQMIKNTDGSREFRFDEAPNPSLGASLELLDYILDNKRADRQRIYLMGLSMGGMGTLELLARRPYKFAAAVSICGGTNPALVPLYAGLVPLRLFHGRDDKVVSVRHSRSVNDAYLETLSRMSHRQATSTYTEYYSTGHNSWDQAFAEPDLLPWLFSHQRQWRY